MRFSSLLIPTVTFAGAAGLSLIVAGISANLMEQSTEIAIRETLDQTGFTWAEVAANGLRVELSGEAPSEAIRFAAISQVGSVVDASRVIDQMHVTPSKGIAPPRFTTEILRNDSGVSLIGLIPSKKDHERIIDTLTDLPNSPPIADFLETAQYPVPKGWGDALGFALRALQRLPRAKISVEAGAVKVTAISDSRDDKMRIEQELTQMIPTNVDVVLDIAAPRPVIAPFTLRYVLTTEGGGFDACSAETPESRDRILTTAEAMGLDTTGGCTIGLGVPTNYWSQAVEQSLAALKELGQGSVTFSDTDVTLIAAEGVSHTEFDRVVGELESALPQVFALHAVLPQPETEAQSVTPELTATLSPEGLLQLRGRLAGENQRDLVDSYAQARFGADSVYVATRNVEGLPATWPIRVMAALDALSTLERGAANVTPDQVSIRGMSHDEDASAAIARLLSEALGHSEDYDLSIAYEAPPAPEDIIMAPERCAAELTAILSKDKISFDPGSANMSTESVQVIDRLAKVLQQCGELPLEIQGHTDSQGRQEMNQNLSQARAQSVLNALRARRLLTGSYSAKGYGETTPIASNETEEGREANRRIEFHVLLDVAAPAETTTEESSETDSQ